MRFALGVATGMYVVDDDDDDDMRGLLFWQTFHLIWKRASMSVANAADPSVYQPTQIESTAGLAMRAADQFGLLPTPKTMMYGFLHLVVTGLAVAFVVFHFIQRKERSADLLLQGKLTEYCQETRSRVRGVNVDTKALRSTSETIQLCWTLLALVVPFTLGWLLSTSVGSSVL